MFFELEMTSVEFAGTLARLSQTLTMANHHLCARAHGFGDDEIYDVNDDSDVDVDDDRVVDDDVDDNGDDDDDTDVDVDDCDDGDDDMDNRP